ncbi:hypothetical protein D0817_21080 [Flavobacterium cupreum]|uniref:Uncharacterized protein n=1 Tax=Flavobacterium cupreum TaxID=2133766 RepID=A0A434A1Z8_9FLAO|nr:hypothetical protein [Flavobacterium cupreum]RUT68409.1 hypothetical protein D0817_21080 [Flavobacterium cupreum]
MKKKFTLEIESPCSENFDAMIPNSGGSFCSSCAKNVIDLSRKTNSEVAKFIAETKDQNICARLKVTQLQEEFQYTETSRINNFKYAAVAASVLITSTLAAQEKTPVKTEISSVRPVSYKLGKVAYSHAAEKEILITIKGRLLETKTNKPLNSAAYPNLELTINDSGNRVKINPETGDFSIMVPVLENSKTFIVTITGNDYYLSKEIPFTKRAVKGAILQQNISIAAEELTKIYMAGGLGINYTGK